MNELKRSTTNRMILGVCGGLGEYFGIDAALVRLVFIVFIFAGGSAILIYIALAIIMPSEGGVDDKELWKNSINHAKGYVGSMFHDNPSAPNATEATSNDFIQRRRYGLGMIIFLIGLFILLNNENLFTAVNFNIVWPAFIMVFGFVLILKRKLTSSLIFLLVIIFLILCVIFSNGIFHVM